MPHERRGPKEWKPGMRPGVVRDPASDPREPKEYHLKFLRRIAAEKDLPSHPELRSNAIMAFEHGDRTELYMFREWHDHHRGERVGPVTWGQAGNLLWFPKSRRAGIVTQEMIDEGEISARWTDADNPLDALSRWVAGEMTDEMGEGG